jgi:hypothetical protein
LKTVNPGEDFMRITKGHYCALALLFVPFMVLAPKAQAQADCSTTAPGSGEAIQCRMGNLLSKNQDVITKLKSHFPACDPANPAANDANNAKCNALQRHLTRAQNAQSRASNAHNNTSADNYHQITLSPHFNRKSNRNGGGGNGGSPPDTVDATYSTTDPGGSGQTVSDQLDEANNALDDASSNLANTPVPSVPPFVPIEQYDFRRDDAFPGWLHPELDEKAWIPALFSIKLAANALEVVDVAMEKPCNEVLVVLGEGGDVPIACLPVALAAAALKATAEMMEFADADLLYWNAKGGYVNGQRAVAAGNQAGSFAAQAAGDTADIRAKVDAIASYIDTTLTPDLNEIKAKLNTLETEVLTNQALLKEVLKMLLLPDGRKTLDPSITTCAGKGCPDPLPQCANGICSFPLK